MLTPVRRLDRLAVARVVARGRSFAGPALGLKVLAAARPLDRTRLAIVIAQKQLKLATRRQLLRRRLRAAIHRLAPRLRPGAEVVIFGRSAAAQLPFPVLAETLTQLLQQAALLNP